MAPAPLASKAVIRPRSEGYAGMAGRPGAPNFLSGAVPVTNF